MKLNPFTIPPYQVLCIIIPHPENAKQKFYHKGPPHRLGRPFAIPTFTVKKDRNSQIPLGIESFAVLDYFLFVML
jgi:hypothetical protein